MLGATKDEDGDAQEQREVFAELVGTLCEAVYCHKDADVADYSQDKERQKRRVHLREDHFSCRNVDAGIFATKAGQSLEARHQHTSAKISEPDDHEKQEVFRLVAEYVAGLAGEEVVASCADDEEADCEEERPDNVSACEGVLKSQKHRSAKTD